MVCPKCGFEMPGGHLLCEKCGCEINIVPEFEPEIENSINETLSTIVNDISPQKAKKVKKSKEEKIEEDFFKETSFGINSKVSRKGIAITSFVLVVLFAVVISASLLAYVNYSTAYLLNKSNSYLKEGNYASALKFAQKAQTVREDDLNIVLKICDIYILMQDYDTALTILTDSVQNKNMDNSTKVLFYSRYVNIYEALEDFDKLNEVLLGFDDPLVVEQFSEYLSVEPKFSVPTGNYSEVIDVEIDSLGYGDVYYTLDGTIPNKVNGIKYNRPIELSGGEFDLKAVYINSYGVFSPIKSSFYMIDVELPTPPIVEPASDTYSTPIKVSVSADDGLQVYYTLDGSVPDTENGLLYSEPIDVPMGHYNFCFVSVNANGMSSDVVRRSYLVDLETKITKEMGRLAVINSLVNQKILKDPNGTAYGDIGTYSFEYDTIIEVPGFGYFYKYDEYLTDKNNIKNPTGLLYAVDVNTADGIFRLTIDNNNNWGLVPLG